MSVLNYRADIEGLRAIAVSLVVLNHIGWRLFSGGFIGVNILFVISGFSITSIISTGLDSGNFSFKMFYIRRCRRILPPLYVVVFVTLIIGYFIYLPNDYSLLSQSALSALAFAANIFFYKNTGGYFSQNAEAMPLLHVWSLSVEEQFYFIWPLIFVGLIKKPIRFYSTIVILVVTSLVLAEIGVFNKSMGAYFLLPFRAYELLSGCLLAVLMKNKTTSPKNIYVSNAISFLGLSLILFPAIFFNDKSPFPGFNALIPFTGTALILLVAIYGSNAISRILSTRILVFMGMISYSIYLWHWPIISLFHYLRMTISPIWSGTIVALSLFLGFLSWKYVENEFRHRDFRNITFIFYATMSSFFMFPLGAAIIYFQEGVPTRFPFSLLTEAQLVAEIDRYWHEVKTTGNSFAEKGQSKKIFLIGDSHAIDLSYALTENTISGEVKY